MVDLYVKCILDTYQKDDYESMAALMLTSFLEMTPEQYEEMLQNIRKSDEMKGIFYDETSI